MRWCSWAFRARRRCGRRPMRPGEHWAAGPVAQAFSFPARDAARWRVVRGRRCRRAPECPMRAERFGD
eukprot:11191161-Lingulodinium_polyedra.AAC.1